MNAAQARRLIGKTVEWLDTYCPRSGYRVREGVILEVSGRNVRVDMNGSSDWKWLPDMHDLKLKP
jgi:hypothetical protein